LNTDQIEHDLVKSIEEAQAHTLNSGTSSRLNLGAAMNYVDGLNGDIAARLARTHEIEKSASMLKMDELKAILHNRGPSNISSEHNA